MAQTSRTPALGGPASRITTDQSEDQHQVYKQVGTTTTTTFDDPGVAEFAAQWPPIVVDDQTRAWQAARATELLAARDERAAEHLRRIDRTARTAGRRVAQGETTIEQAARTVDAQVLARDEDHVVRVFVSPLADGRATADAAFAAGVIDARKAAR